MGPRDSVGQGLTFQTRGIHLDSGAVFGHVSENTGHSEAKEKTHIEQPPPSWMDVHSSL